MRSDDAQFKAYAAALLKAERYTYRATLEVRRNAVKYKDYEVATATSALQREYTQALADSYRNACLLMGRAVYDALLWQKAAEPVLRKDAASQWEQYALQWLYSEGAAAITTITETTINDVRTVLVDAVLQGQGTYTPAKALRDYIAISKNRARTIAITETHNAASFASRQTAQYLSQQTGLQFMKKWNAKLDGRTRPAHASASRLPAIPIDQKFRVDGVLMDRPGDPAGGASNVIRCRCVLTYTDNFDEMFN